MSWTRWDDNMDEELAFLGHEAFRLYTVMVTYGRRNNRAGRLHLARDIVPQAAKHRIRRLTAAIAELVSSTDDEPPLWTQEGEFYTIRAYAKFNPLTSKERMRKHRHRDAVGDVTATSRVVTVTPSHAGASALGHPEPVPVPEPVPTTERSDERPVSRAEGGAMDEPLVVGYIEACRAAGVNDLVIMRQVHDLHASVIEARMAAVPEPQLAAAVLALAANGGSARRLDIEIGRAQRRALQQEGPTTRFLREHGMSTEVVDDPSVWFQAGETPPPLA